MAEQPSPDDAVQAVADSLFVPVAAAVIGLTAGWLRSIALADLRLAAEAGGATLVAAIPWLALQERYYTRLWPLLGRALQGGAVAGGQALSPESVQVVAQRLASRLAADLLVTSRQAAEQVVARGVREGWTADQLARALRPTLGLAPRQAVALARYQAELAGQGLAAAQVAQQTTAYRARLLDSRARMIAETEVTRLVEEGAYAGWGQALARREAQDVWRIWRVAFGACTAICRPMAGQRVRYGQPFALPSGGTVLHPPTHPACRCGVIYEEDA